MEKLFIKEMCKKYNKSEKFIKLLVKICEDKNLTDKEKIVNKVCQKVCQSKQTKEHNTVK